MPVGSAGAISPLQVIRERTRPLHAELESAIDLNQHLGSVEQYGELLRRYLRVYRPFEELLGRQAGEAKRLIALVYDSKVVLLERDLSLIGHIVNNSSASDDVAMLPLESVDEVLGALYVVEGSALGGQYLYREVERRLQLNGLTGAAFFLGDGAETGSRWKRFTSLFEEHVADGDRAAAAAGAMFGVFRQGLVGSVTGRSEG